MLLRYDLRSWAAKQPNGELVDYVVASEAEEAANIVHKITSLESFTLVEVNPLTGEEM